VAALVVTAPDEHLSLLEPVLDDVRAAGHVDRAELRPGPGPQYEVLLQYGGSEEPSPGPAPSARG
jgi:hypothetical protein